MSHSMSWRGSSRRTDSLLSRRPGRSERAQRLLDSKRMPGLDRAACRSPSWPNVPRASGWIAPAFCFHQGACGAVSQKLRRPRRGIARSICDRRRSDYEDAIARLEAQMGTYDGFVRTSILPRARDGFRRPEELYAFDLEQRGIDAPPRCSRRSAARLYEIQLTMNALAPKWRAQRDIHLRITAV